MALTVDQRHALLLAARSQSVDLITAAVDQVLTDDPDADLLDCEAAFRDGAAQAYVIADGAKFHIVLGMQAWRAALAEVGVSSGENRAMLLIWRLRKPDHRCLSVDTDRS
jgi:phage baseplate assembly protein gpV